MDQLVTTTVGVLCLLKLINYYSGSTVSIEIDKDAKPISCKPHRIPESIKCKVKTLWTNS